MKNMIQGLLIVIGFAVMFFAVGYMDRAVNPNPWFGYGGIVVGGLVAAIGCFWASLTPEPLPSYLPVRAGSVIVYQPNQRFSR